MHSCLDRFNFLTNAETLLTFTDNIYTRYRTTPTSENAFDGRTDAPPYNGIICTPYNGIICMRCAIGGGTCQAVTRRGCIYSWRLRRTTYRVRARGFRFVSPTKFRSALVVPAQKYNETL